MNDDYYSTLENAFYNVFKHSSKYTMTIYNVIVDALNKQDYRFIGIYKFLKQSADIMYNKVDYINENDTNSIFLILSILKIMEQNTHYGIKDIIKYSKRLNTAPEQFILLHFFIQYNGYINLLDIGDMLFYTGQSNKIIKTKRNDLENRANIIASYLQNLNEIVILDGHGRFLYLLLLQLYNTIDKDITITICENDKYTYYWHELLFPILIYSKTGYSIRIQNVFVDITEYVSWNNTNKLIYFNYCGVGGDENLANLLYYLVEQHPLNLPLFISIDNSYPASKTFCDTLININKLMSSGCFNIETIGKRKRFKTFKFIKKYNNCNKTPLYCSDFQ